MRGLIALLRRTLLRSRATTRLVRRVGKRRLLRAVVLVIVLALAAGTLIALLLGSVLWTVAFLGALTVLMMGVVVFTVRIVRRDIAGLTKQYRRVEGVQRRILAAVEQERLDAAERNRALLAAVNAAESVSETSR